MKRLNLYFLIGLLCLASPFFEKSARADFACTGRCHDLVHACLRPCTTAECHGRCHDQFVACLRGCGRLSLKELQMIEQIEQLQNDISSMLEDSQLSEQH